MNVKTVTMLTAIAMLAGCAHTQNTTRNQQDDNLQLSYTIRDGYHQGQRDTQHGYFVVFDVSEEQTPKIIDIYQENPRVQDWKNKEILFVSRDLSEVQPAWRTWYEYDEGSETFTCWKGIFRSEEYSKRHDYNPCDSILRDNFASKGDVGRNTFNAVFSLGLTALTGTAQYSTRIDRLKVAQLIENTQMMAAIQTRQRELAAQEAEHAEIARLEEERQQQIRERQRQIEAAAMEQRRQQAAIERQQREVEYTRWRRTLAVGSSTFCGFVIERNGPIVRIAVNTPLQGYDAEQWLKIEEVFPEHLGCRNINGRLQTARDP